MKKETSKVQKETYASQPMFLKSVMKPVESRLEMAKLPKMCSNSFYGN